MNGEPPQPLAPNTQLCGWVGLRSPSNHCQMPDWRWISLLDLYPIYAEEADLICGFHFGLDLVEVRPVLVHGHEEFAKRLQHHQIPQWIDPQRPNMADPRYALPEELGGEEPQSDD